MALIRCPECRNRVSDMAASCPKCGCPLPEEAKKGPSASGDDEFGRGDRPQRSRNVSLLLAFRNLIHDRASLAATTIGIVFSVVLVTVQCGLYVGAEKIIASMNDHSEAALWIVSSGAESFDDPNLLRGNEKYVALGTPGVAEVEELVVDFARWSKPGGGISTILVIGSDPDAATLVPWNIVEGTLQDLRAPAAILVDKSYLSDLGVHGRGATAEINGARANVYVLSEGIRSFTTIPYVFMTLREARKLLAINSGDATYLLVGLSPNSSLEKVRAALQERLPDVEVLTHDEFRTRGVDNWMFQTGAGAALIAGVVLGLVVGLVVVSQTLYASTKDHINEFATMRALGASAGYIQRIILVQAVISAIVGYGLGMALSLGIAWATQGTDMAIVITPVLAGLIFLLTLGMCVGAAMSAIIKVTRIDPAGVFSR